MSGPIVKMAPNVPVAMKIRFVDVWPNDPSKDPKGKGYGSQVSVKGEVGGERDTLIYLKGLTSVAIGQLESAGVIARSNYMHDPGAKYSIPVMSGDVTMVLDQPADERYPKLKITANGNGKPAKKNEKQEGLNVGKLPSDDDASFADSLVNADAEQAAELDAKINPDTAAIRENKRAAVRTAHKRAFAHIVNEYVPFAIEKGVLITLEGVSALTFQLFKCQEDIR